MSKKGSWKGECFTPGCASVARHIATAEGPRVEEPQERYRCARCCDLVGLAVPPRKDDVHPGRPGWDEWCAEIDAIFALPLTALQVAAAMAGVRNVFFELEGSELETLRAALNRPGLCTLRIDTRRDGIAWKVNEGGWSPTVGAAKPRG